MPKKKIEPEYWIDDKVIIISEPERGPLRVIKVIITPEGFMYTLRHDGAEVDFYPIELTGPEIVPEAEK